MNRCKTLCWSFFPASIRLWPPAAGNAFARRPRHSGFEWFAIKGKLSHRGGGGEHWGAAPGVGVRARLSARQSLSKTPRWVTFFFWNRCPPLISPPRHEEHLEPPDDTEDCDLTHSHASRPVIRITQLWQYVSYFILLDEFTEGSSWRMGRPPPTTNHQRTNNSPSVRSNTNPKYLYLNSWRHLLVRSIWFTPADAGSILLQHESHLRSKTTASALASVNRSPTHSRQDVRGGVCLRGRPSAIGIWLIHTPRIWV